MRKPANESLNRRRSVKRRRRGAIIALVPVLILALAGIGVLMIDLGHITAVKSDAQNAADAAGRGFAFYAYAGMYAIVYTSPESANGGSYGWRYNGNWSWQKADLIDADVIRADAIQAEQLEISSSTNTGGERMYFNGPQNRIEIYDGVSNFPRVMLGKLT
mgnify:CR=1 FL=1